MTKIIGLTGGIGSGKTTIANHLKSLGFPVYNSDEQAKSILNSIEIVNNLKIVLGIEIFTNGLLDKKKLSNLVFNDPEKLKLLNQIIHPAVKVDFKNWLEVHKNFPIVIKEAAILFESGSYKDCDAVITIDAPQDIRIQRVIKRDQLSYEEVMSRINNQWTDTMRKNKSDYVVDNQDINIACVQTENIIKNLLNY
ncbi:MAG: dephospho-CoA kinase [Flavobacteriaceae bacterium]|jgi:dephospho-CoA kinase|nr:dephospho-CoA kinase [Flavobacteriaceae bacterium]